MPRRIFLRLKIRLSVLLALLLPLWVAGAEPKVRGTLSTNSASVGDVVEYELIIEGELADQPPAPSVDGIEVHGPRVNRQMSFINGNVSNRLILTYSLVPKREGKFIIPALEMRVGGRLMKTMPATLTVDGEQGTVPVKQVLKKVVAIKPVQKKPLKPATPEGFKDDPYQ